VTLPLAWPGILAASIYIFVIGFAALETPAIIGWGNRLFTFSTYILDLVRGDGGLPHYGAVAALSVPLMVWAALMTWFYDRVQRRARQYETVFRQGLSAEAGGTRLGALASAGSSSAHICCWR